MSIDELESKIPVKPPKVNKNTKPNDQESEGVEEKEEPK